MLGYLAIGSIQDIVTKTGITEKVRKNGRDEDGRHRHGGKRTREDGLAGAANHLVSSTTS